MDEQWNPDAVKQLLDSALGQIDQSTLVRLHAARAIAVNRRKAGTAILPLLAWSGVPVTQHAPVHRHKLYQWIGILLIAACIVNGIVYSWQQAMNDDASDVDIQILTGDLPIEYFLG